MFTNGSGDLVLHFIADCNAKLTEILAEQHNRVQLGQAEYVLQARPLLTDLSSCLRQGTTALTLRREIEREL